ncbi:sugar transferase [Thermoleophilia bacterium SCSIO 60948]|nr:sugar transferase [Thermoleophilia bacterium SCSIO 60948]
MPETTDIEKPGAARQPLFRRFSTRLTSPATPPAERSARRFALLQRVRLASNTRPYYMRRVLAGSDIAAVASSFIACALLERVTSFQASPDNPWLVLPLALVAWTFLAGITAMYHVDDRRIDCSSSEEMFPVAQLVALWIWIVLGADALLTPNGAPTVTAAITLGLVAAPMILLFRAASRRWAYRRSWYRQSALIVGTHVDCERVRRTLARHPEYAVAIAGELHPTASSDPDSSVPSLIDFMADHEVDRVIFASNYEGLDERTGALRFLAERGVKVDLVPGDSDAFRHDAELHHIEGLPLLTLPNTNRARSAEAIKRFVDLGAASVGLVLLSPVFLVSAAAIKLGSRGPVLFRQTRVGKGGEPFEVLKFRTMVADAEERKAGLDQMNTRTDGMFKISDDPRITGAGNSLRKYSLDELPQLINVLRGEMSLVGPRPLIPEESVLVSAHFRARFDVRPGITGPWQVLGRSDIPFDDMVKLDYTYVINWTLVEDLKLMARTVGAMGGGRGAY